MRRMLVLIIQGYQVLLSPLFPPCCRFLPTCSEYARQALQIHGPLKGLILTAWRLLRCHPLCSGGYDPVPFSWPGKATSALNKRRSAPTNINPTVF